MVSTIVSRKWVPDKWVISYMKQQLINTLFQYCFLKFLLGWFQVPRETLEKLVIQTIWGANGVYLLDHVIIAMYWAIHIFHLFVVVLYVSVYKSLQVFVYNKKFAISIEVKVRYGDSEDGVLGLFVWASLMWYTSKFEVNRLQERLQETWWKSAIIITKKPFKQTKSFTWEVTKGCVTQQGSFLHEHARPLNKRFAWRLTAGSAFIKTARLKPIIEIILLVDHGECARD